MKKSDLKVMRTRNSILAFVVIIAILVIGYGTMYSTGVNQGEFVAGEHYTILENTQRRRAGQQIEVREFFSYGCIHCRNFDPLVEKWQTTLPEGVTFSRIPVVFSPIWSLLAQSYMAMEQLGILSENHERMFRQVQDNRVQFLSANEIADFIAGHGATREEFLEAFNSPEVRRMLRDSDRMQREYGISAVPTLTVNDKYVISMNNGRKVALEIVNHIIAMEQAGPTPDAS